MDARLVALWGEVLQKVARDPQWVGATEKIGSVPRILSPEATAEFVLVLVAFAVVLRGRRSGHATLNPDGVSCGDTRRPSERVAVRRRAPRG